MVKPIPQIVDADGEPIAAEMHVEPVELIGCKQLEQRARDSPAKLAEADAVRLATAPGA